MAAHPTWKGFLKLSLVSFPVRAYTAVGEGEKIHFNQFHAVLRDILKLGRMAVPAGRDMGSRRGALHIRFFQKATS
jgi:non-homologous end joining protein Ku